MLNLAGLVEIGGASAGEIGAVLLSLFFSEHASGPASRVLLLLGLACPTALIAVGLSAIAPHFAFEAIVGAFMAEDVLRLVDPTAERTHPRFHIELEGLGHGFLVPVFFVTSGVQFYLGALFADTRAVLRVPMFLAALLLVRGLPAAVYGRAGLSWPEVMPSGLLQATSLPVIVAATTIGLKLDAIRPVNAAALVAAGLVVRDRVSSDRAALAEPFAGIRGAVAGGKAELRRFPRSAARPAPPRCRGVRCPEEWERPVLRMWGHAMPIVSPGFHGRARDTRHKLPPGQYETADFPVLSAGPTPRVDLAEWEFSIRTETGARHSWNWEEFMALPSQTPTVDLHCVTKWSKFDTEWQGVSLDVLLEDVGTSAEYTLVHSYGDYSTNVPLEDLLDGQAWIAYRYDGDELPPEHGGPARLLIPHLYFWKSAKWVRGIQLLHEEERGFWENIGYHDYGDPWREQRYQGD